MIGKYCYQECRNPWFSECADCWRSGGNPVLGTTSGTNTVPNPDDPQNVGSKPETGQKRDRTVAEE